MQHILQYHIQSAGRGKRGQHPEVIPEGCTHYVNRNPHTTGAPLWKFYRVLGPEHDVVRVWLGGVWVSWVAYEEQAAEKLKQLDPKMYADRRARLSVPDFNAPWMLRAEDTANDIIKRIKV